MGRGPPARVLPSQTGQQGRCGLHSTCCRFIPGPRRKVLYQRAPRNIHRHVVLSEVKEAVAALPPVRQRGWGWELCHMPGPSPHSQGFEGWSCDLTGLRAVTQPFGALEPASRSAKVGLLTQVTI